MKKSILLLLMLVFIVPLYGQLNNKVGKTPAVSRDWQPGVINITEINYGLGLGETDVPYSKSYFGVTNVTGYQFSRNAKAGIGIGFQQHNGGTLIPVFIDGRLSPDMQDVVPFLAVAGGLAVSPDNMNSQTRVFVNPSVGVRFISLPRVILTGSVGLMTQAGGGESRSSFICFKFGTEFKKVR